MNKTLITGRLVSPKQSTYLDRDGLKCSRVAFMVASQEQFERDEEGKKVINWVPCVAFGDTAGNLVKYCKEGDWIEVDGTVESRYYTNAAGKKMLTTRVRTQFISYGVKARKNEMSQEQETQKNNIKQVLGNYNTTPAKEAVVEDSDPLDSLI